MRKYTVETIAVKLRSVLGDSFTYPKLADEYKMLKSIITVVCPIHGDFNTSVSSLIHCKTLCPKCSQVRRLLSDRQNQKFAYLEMKRLYAFVNKLSDAERKRIIRQHQARWYDQTVAFYNLFKLRSGHSDYLSNSLSD